MADTEAPIVLASRDARGVVTLTLNRPRALNALSEAMLAALKAELDTVARDPTARAVVLAAAGKAFSRRPRPQGDAGLAEPRLLPRPVLRLHRGDARDPPPAGAGDRPRPRHRHRGGMPARRPVRSRRRLERGALRGERRQLRPVLLDAERRARTERAPQAGDGDAPHRRFHRRGGGPRPRPRQPRRGARPARRRGRGAGGEDRRRSRAPRSPSARSSSTGRSRPASPRPTPSPARRWPAT